MKKLFQRKGSGNPAGLAANSHAEVSAPQSFSHRGHVSTDLCWAQGTSEGGFELGALLGKGAFGSVWQAMHRDSGSVFALKELASKDAASLEEVRKEIEILKECRHTNVVSYYGTAEMQQGPGKLYLIMELCNLSVRDLIERLDEPIPEPVVVQITKQAVKGLVYIHSRNIVHRVRGVWGVFFFLPVLRF